MAHPHSLVAPGYTLAQPAAQPDRTQPASPSAAVRLAPTSGVESTPTLQSEAKSRVTLQIWWNLGVGSRNLIPLLGTVSWKMTCYPASLTAYWLRRKKITSPLHIGRCEAHGIRQILALLRRASFRRASARGQELRTPQTGSSAPIPTVQTSGAGTASERSCRLALSRPWRPT